MVELKKLHRYSNFNTLHIIFVAGAFLSAVGGISAFVGFSAALSAAKKADPKYFNKGKDSIVRYLCLKFNVFLLNITVHRGTKQCGNG